MNVSKFFLLFCSCFVVCILGHAGTKQISAPHVTLDLISEADSIGAGQRFWVGLYFKLEPGWHVYWMNPGDSGEPPQVQWRLPDGFKAGEIQWLYPERIPVATLMNFGYEREILLPIEVHAPTGLSPGSQVNLNASAKWLVCREVCIPGKGDVSLTLQVGSAGSSGSEVKPLFARARARMPRRLPADWRIRAAASADELVLTVHAGGHFKKIEFFPAEPLQIENSAPQKLIPNSQGFRLILKRSEQATKPPTRLKGVLVADSHAYGIDVSVEVGPKR